MKNILLDEIDQFTPKKIKWHTSKYDQEFHQKSSIFADYSWVHVFYVCAVLCIYVIFVSRALSIQIIRQDKYLSLANQNRIREFSVLPSRGLIYDTNNNLIVRNKPSFSVQINTLICDLKNSPEICQASLDTLSHYLPIEDPARISKQLESFQTNILIANGLTKEQILPIEANISQMPGVSIETSPVRDYLYDNIFSHLIGYVGFGDALTPEIVGKTGVEYVYNKDLSGVMGTKIVQVNASGTSYKLITQNNPFPGNDLTLFADIDLQKKAYELLKQKVDEDEDTTGGAIVAQDPTNGGILALVSYPAYSPQKMVSGITSQELALLNSDPSFPFFNRAISAVYPPGSTFKLVTASAVLMEGIATKYLTINDPGYLQVGSFIFRNWKLDGHGLVDLIRALQVSNDTYFYTVGGGYGGVKGLGIKKLHDWAQKFGFGQLTGVDLNSEASGFMPDGKHRDWYLGDDYISAIGQGDILSTPLQVNSMFTYFANGGYLYKPRAVKSTGVSGETLMVRKQYNLISPEFYDLVREGAHKSVISGGTGWPLFDFTQRHPGIMLAGKTGTSEYLDPQGNPKTHAWFSVFGPYKENYLEQANLNSSEDRPIVLTVFLEGGGGGSGDAAPIAKELLDLWFTK